MLSIHLPTPQGIMTNYPLVTTEERPTVITPRLTVSPMPPPTW